MKHYYRCEYPRFGVAVFNAPYIHFDSVVTQTPISVHLKFVNIFLSYFQFLATDPGQCFLLMSFLLPWATESSQGKVASFVTSISSALFQASDFTILTIFIEQSEHDVNDMFCQVCHRHCFGHVAKRLWNKHTCNSIIFLSMLHNSYSDYTNNVSNSQILRLCKPNHCYDPHSVMQSYHYMTQCVTIQMLCSIHHTVCPVYALMERPLSGRHQWWRNGTVRWPTSVDGDTGQVVEAEGRVHIIDALQELPESQVLLETDPLATQTWAKVGLGLDDPSILSRKPSQKLIPWQHTQRLKLASPPSAENLVSDPLTPFVLHNG